MNKNLFQIFVITSLFLAIQSYSIPSYSQEQCYAAFDKKDYANAEKCFKIMTVQNPRDYKARTFLAKTYSYENQLDKAINEYRKISEETPNSVYGQKARSTMSMLSSAKLLFEAKERIANKNPKDILKGALICDKSPDQSFMMCLFPCDGKLLIKKDGTKTMTYPDGEIIEEKPNGMYEIHSTTGSITKSIAAFTSTQDNFRKICKPQKDGSIFIQRNDGTQEYHFTNGDVKIKMPSGQVLLESKGGHTKILASPLMHR